MVALRRAGRVRAARGLAPSGASARRCRRLRGGRGSAPARRRASSPLTPVAGTPGRLGDLGRARHHGRLLPHPLRDLGAGGGRSGGFSEPIHLSLAVAGARAASTVRIPADRTATRAPRPQVPVHDRRPEPWKASVPPATTTATVAAARHRRYGASISRTSGCSPLRSTSPLTIADDESRIAIAGLGRPRQRRQVGEQPRQRQPERDHPRHQRGRDEEAAALGPVVHAQPRLYPRSGVGDVVDARPVGVARPLREHRSRGGCRSSRSSAPASRPAPRPRRGSSRPRCSPACRRSATTRPGRASGSS